MGAGLRLALAAGVLCAASTAALAADARCLACHGRPGFASPSGKSVFVDAGKLAASIHGTAGQACTDCHADLAGVDTFPHAAKLKPAVCADCHDKVAAAYAGSVHGALSGAASAPAASCAECHGSHDILSAAVNGSRISRKNIVATCGECHGDISEEYLAGVHGRDYVRGGPDVPVCTDCHAGHDIRRARDPRSSVYVAKVGRLCSRCHDDETLARRYRFLTSRLPTFRTSYHGAAIEFGETRVANCASCHGFHNIRPSSDPQSPIAPQNLPKTCGRCHAGAGRNFARGKIHDISGGPGHPAAHVIRGIYQVLIAGLVALFFLYISADVVHGMKEKWTRK